MNDELTEWYPCTTEPVRKGWYQVKRMNMHGGLLDKRRLYWDGRAFKWTKKGIGQAAVIDRQDFWRGLARRPAK